MVGVAWRGKSQEETPMRLLKPVLLTALSFSYLGMLDSRLDAGC